MSSFVATLPFTWRRSCNNSRQSQIGAFVCWAHTSSVKRCSRGEQAYHRGIYNKVNRHLVCLRTCCTGDLCNFFWDSMARSPSRNSWTSLSAGWSGVRAERHHSLSHSPTLPLFRAGHLARWTVASALVTSPPSQHGDTDVRYNLLTYYANLLTYNSKPI